MDNQSNGNYDLDIQSLVNGKGSLADQYNSKISQILPNVQHKVGIEITQCLAENSPKCRKTMINNLTWGKNLWMIRWSQNCTVLHVSIPYQKVIGSKATGQLFGPLSGPIRSWFSSYLNFESWQLWFCCLLFAPSSVLHTAHFLLVLAPNWNSDKVYREGDDPQIPEVPY